MFCMECGRQITDSQTKFCPWCGAPVLHAPAGQQNAGSAQQAYQGATQPTATVAQPQTWQLLQHVQSQAAPLGTFFTFNTKDGSRSGIYMACRTPGAQAAQVAAQILAANGFKPYEYKGESVYKKGTGLAMAMQYVKFMPSANSLYVEGWVVMGVGSVGLNEMDLNGVLQPLPKKSLMKVLNKIQAAV